MKLEQNFSDVQKLVGHHETEIELQKSILESLDNDMLILLKKFKDILSEVANKKIKNN